MFAFREHREIKSRDRSQTHILRTLSLHEFQLKLIKTVRWPGKKRPLQRQKKDPKLHKKVN